MPSNKSPGPDKVSMRIIKDCLRIIPGPLTDIINCSLATSTFPNSWKASEVIPLLKDDSDHEEPSNNPPLLMLTVASKICEKVALQQFSSYLQHNGLLNNHQGGNCKYHSTETLNIMISNFLIDAKDNERLSALILLDLSKALLAILYYCRSWALLLLTKPQNGLRVTWLTELRWSVLAHLHLHPSLSPMAYHRAPYCHPFCFAFISVIFLSLHKYAISSPT